MPTVILSCSFLFFFLLSQVKLHNVVQSVGGLSCPMIMTLTLHHVLLPKCLSFTSEITGIAKRKVSMYCFKINERISSSTLTRSQYEIFHSIFQSVASLLVCICKYAIFSSTVKKSEQVYLFIIPTALPVL